MVTYGRPPTPTVRINGQDSFSIIPADVVYTSSWNKGDYPNAFQYGWGSDSGANSNIDDGDFHGQTFTNLKNHGTTHYAKYRVQSNSGWSPWSPIRSFLMPAGAYVKYNGTWKRALVYVKVNGTWKLVQPLVRYQGFWIETRS